MIRVSVLYPNSDGSRFDMDYYLKHHIPMVQQFLGDTLKSIGVDRGLSGAAPDTAPAYVAMAHLTFDSREAFDAAFGPHAETIMADIPNYTDINPIIQVSEAAS